LRFRASAYAFGAWGHKHLVPNTWLELLAVFNENNRVNILDFLILEGKHPFFTNKLAVDF
jgi:hypothetical protein